MKNATKEAPEFGTIDGVYSGPVIKLSITEGRARNVRSEGKTVNFFELLNNFDIPYSIIGQLGAHGLLIFLQELQYSVRTNPDTVDQNNGDTYTSINIYSPEGEKLFIITFDPNNESDKYSVVKVVK